MERRKAVGFIGADNLIHKKPITVQGQKILCLFAISIGHLCTLKRAEEQIKADNREKELLLKEINHRVKNNLQIIACLLNLQSRQIVDPRMLRVFDEGRNRIHAMAQAHEMLYDSKGLGCNDFGGISKTG